MAFLAVASNSMRLYRGLKNPYRPELVAASRLSSGTDFTDCPATALLYAQSPRGVLLVVDIDIDPERPGLPRVTKELWLNDESSRYVFWGQFDDSITATFLAKDLRTQLRKARLRNASLASKSYALRHFISDELHARSLRAKLALRSEFAERVDFHE